MGVCGIYGCGCMEVYRFPHITYPYSSCICSFWPTFFVHLKNSFLFRYFLVIYVIIFSAVYKACNYYCTRHGWYVCADG